MAVSAVRDNEVFIQAGQSASNPINLEDGLRLFGALFQADWVEANLAPQMSLDDGANWKFITRKGIHNVIKAIADECCMVDNPVDFAVFPSFRFLSVSKTDDTTPVVQTVEQKLELICRTL